MITDWKVIENKDGSFSVLVDAEDDVGHATFGYLDEEELHYMLREIDVHKRICSGSMGPLGFGTAFFSLDLTHTTSGKYATKHKESRFLRGSCGPSTNGTG